MGSAKELKHWADTVNHYGTVILDWRFYKGKRLVLGRRGGKSEGGG